MSVVDAVVLAVVVALDVSVVVDAPVVVLSSSSVAEPPPLTPDESNVHDTIAPASAKRRSLPLGIEYDP
jgi:hypothetical protein